MARQDNDGHIDPALVAAWRRMLWLMRGSADVVEAMVPTAAGMTKDEISRLLARAGAPSGKGVEPVEQVLGLLGVVPRSRYEALLAEHKALIEGYEELAGRVAEAEQNIENLRRVLREQGLVDEAEQLLDSWGGLVRRTLRAQAGFVRSIAGAGGGDVPPSTPADGPGPEQVPEEVPEPEATAAADPEPEPPDAGAKPAPRRKPATSSAKKKSTTSRARTNGRGTGTPSSRSTRPNA
ncbi:MAG: hypothetical protein J2P38_01740 [Candidatus Dormibacteraeota bacterium]|nr:hypothetical protein [Candidatus Dormibacteraeota bacterium]